MLVVNRLGPEAARYYLGDGPPGEWRGAAALRLGVEGAVDGADLAAVLAGRDPRTGAPLALRRVAHRRAGWDLIFAAPKSVSLLHGLAPPPRAAAIADAQARAVDDVVAWLEAQACWARRGARLVAAEGLVAACYHHRRSAAGDPHLHTHLLVGNLAGTADGRWSALDGSSLWVHRRATAAAYHLSLRHHLGSLGLDRWRQAPDGSFEVDGVPRGAIEASSRRRAEVVAAVAAEGGVTRTARRAARVRTRSAVGGEWYTAVSGAGFGILEAAGLARQPEGAPAALGASGERATAVLPGDAGAGTLEAEAAAR
ncbi:MAG TPA: MobF family relaxase, partial [Acidimicrobiales bacterium]|nr:MobF family relaxase [Acidimicrobiales bacterium]